MTEEYCLLPAVLSFYLEFNWLYDHSKEYGNKLRSHPAYLFFIDGLCFGAIFMMNMKNAATIVIFDLLLAVVMLIDREYADLFKNILAAACGAFCAVLPFVIYFAMNGALSDMIEDAVIFIFSYASSRGLIVPVTYLIIFSIPEIMLLLAGI